MSLLDGVACGESTSSTILRRLLLLMDCTTFSELLDVILKDTAVFFCIIEDTTVVFEDTAASFFLASYAALDSRDDL